MNCISIIFYSEHNVPKKSEMVIHCSSGGGGGGSGGGNGMKIRSPICYHQGCRP